MNKKSPRKYKIFTCCIRDLVEVPKICELYLGILDLSWLSVSLLEQEFPWSISVWRLASSCVVSYRRGFWLLIGWWWCVCLIGRERLTADPNACLTETKFPPVLCLFVELVDSEWSRFSEPRSSIGETLLDRAPRQNDDSSYSGRFKWLLKSSLCCCS